MFDSLYSYISSRVEVSREEFDLIKNSFIQKELARGEYLLKEGSVCRYAAFVTEGTLRQYLIDDKGNEHVTQFAIENWWISDRESFANGVPSHYNIDSIEDSKLLLITFEEFRRLEENSKSFKELVDLIKERSAFAGQKRVVRALSYSAEEKYREFITSYPEIVQRVPQHMTASYLGITPETLSRLRRKFVTE